MSKCPRNCKHLRPYVSDEHSSEPNNWSDTWMYKCLLFQEDLGLSPNKIDKCLEITQANNMEQRLIAFWKYDQYPFILCGEVIKFDNNGGVHTVEYPGHAPRPILILPHAAGQELKLELERLRMEYNTADKELEETYFKKIPTRLRNHLS